jgi:outer membrane protein TolC
MKNLIPILFLASLFQISIAQQKSLNDYISKGLTNSPLLKDYRNQQQLNLIDSMRLHASLGAQVNATSNNTYAPVFNGWGHDEAITNGANITALLAVSKEITSKRNRENQFKSIRLDNQNLQITAKISEQDLKKNITEQYILTYGLLQQYHYNIDLLILLKKEEQIFKKLTEQGIYKQTDYLAFIVNLRQQELGSAQIKIQYQGSLTQLNALCGNNDTSSVILADPDLTLVTPPEVRNTLLYQQFITDSLKLYALDKQIDFMYKPKVSLYADAGYNSSLILTPWKNFGPSVGVSVSIPVYDGHQRQLQHDKVVVSERTRQNYREFYTNNYKQQVNALLQQLKAITQIEDQTSEQLKFTQTLIDANRKLIETGDAQVTDYIIAISNYLTAKNMIVQNTVAKYLLINQINYLNLSK